MQLTTPERSDIRGFLDEIRAVDGHPPLSGNKIAMVDREDGRVAAWADGEGLCLVGVAARYSDPGHWAVEAALAERMRRATDEEAAIRAAVGLVPEGEAHSFWSFREAQVDAAHRLGYAELRAVLRMTGSIDDIALRPVPGVEITPIRDTDIPMIVEINNRAFAGHREQGAMTEAGFLAMAELAWFRLDGVLVARAAQGVIGFCVTKREGSEVGEVYLLAVDPDASGMGLGSALAAAGFNVLADQGATRAVVWTDETNRAAIRVYRMLGLAEDFRNRELAPATGS